jgi:hypothetical protein
VCVCVCLFVCAISKPRKLHEIDEEHETPISVLAAAREVFLNAPICRAAALRRSVKLVNVFSFVVTCNVTVLIYI